MITMHHHLQGDSKIINDIFRHQSAASFKHQMIMLKQRKSQATDPTNIKVTLDDGLRSQKTAAKILRDLSLTGIFYYSTRPTLGEYVLEVHLVHILLKLLDREQKRQLLDDILKNSTSEFNFSDAKYIYRKQGEFSIDQKLKFIINYFPNNGWNEEVLNFYLERYTNLYLQDLNKEIYLNTEDLQFLRSEGHTVLPHGHTHRLLGKMNKSELVAEFSSMKEIHSALFDEEFDELCVPYGSKYSWSVLSEEIAYDFGVTNVMLVDETDTVFSSKNPSMCYYSRIDCCLLEHYEYL